MQVGQLIPTISMTIRRRDGHQFGSNRPSISQQLLQPFFTHTIRGDTTTSTGVMNKQSVTEPVGLTNITVGFGVNVSPMATTSNFKTSQAKAGSISPAFVNKDVPTTSYRIDRTLNVSHVYFPLRTRKGILC